MRAAGSAAVSQRSVALWCTVGCSNLTSSLVVWRTLALRSREAETPSSAMATARRTLTGVAKTMTSRDGVFLRLTRGERAPSIRYRLIRIAVQSLVCTLLARAIVSCRPTLLRRAGPSESHATSVQRLNLVSMRVELHRNAAPHGGRATWAGPPDAKLSYINIVGIPLIRRMRRACSAPPALGGRSMHIIS